MALFCVVLDVPGAPHNEVVGPFMDEKYAATFVARNVGAPAGSEAFILPLIPPVDYAAREEVRP